MVPGSEMSGAELAGTTYSHPLYAGRVHEVVVGGDYITTESGTGLVHTAPGHGQVQNLIELCKERTHPSCI